MKKLLYIAPISLNNNINNSADGYSQASDGMLRVFDRMRKEGLIDSFDCKNVNTYFKLDDDYEYCFLNVNIYSFLNSEKLVEFYKEVKKRCKKLYVSIVWETDRIPEAWLKILNLDIFDGFLCPSKFVMNLLKDIDKPKFLYPHFIDDEIYSQLDINSKQNEKYFTVLTLGQNTKRKSFRESIIAFTQALGNKEDCRLIIKSNTLGNIEDNIDTVIARYGTLNGISKAKIFSIKDKSLSPDEMVDLYKGSSLMLLCSKAEGFGLALPEAMMIGLPCTYLNWSAWDEDYYNIMTNKTIKYYLDYQNSMSTYGYPNKSKWAYPIYESMVENLEYFYNEWNKNKIEYYKKSVDFNRNIIMNKYSYELIKQHVMNIFEGKQ